MSRIPLVRTTIRVTTTMKIFSLRIIGLGKRWLAMAVDSAVLVDPREVVDRTRARAVRIVNTEKQFLFLVVDV